MADIRVYFATNRNHQSNNKHEVFGKHFNPDGVAALRFGFAEYIRGDHGPSLAAVTVYEDKKGPDDKSPGSRNLLDDLHAAMAGARTDTLIFIHGFSVSFLDALEAGARLAEELVIKGSKVNVVVFTWPSDGEKVPWMSYYSDREDARASGPALARTYLMLRQYVSGLTEDEHCERRLHLLAHSMGNYVLRNGLQAILAKDPNSLVRLFDQILMAAPDEDDDAFETDQKLRLLPKLCRQVTVYFNPNDQALVVSDKTKSNPDRLGSDGPRLIDLIPKKVVLVDCRKVAMHADKWIGHSYYVNSLAMSRDLVAVLAGEEPDRIQNRDYLLAKRVWQIIRELEV